MKSLQRTQNDLVVNFNDVIRIAHCALNIELTQPVAMDSISTKNENTVQFYFVVLKMSGLKYSDSNNIVILEHENRPVVWSGPYNVL